jgi:hypothetical protein
MKDPGWWADVLDPRGLSQGDLLDSLPFPYFRAPLTHLKKIQVKKHGDVWQPASKPSLHQQDQTYYALGGCATSLGLIISHGCAIDKGDDRVLAAPVLPMTSLKPEMQDTVRRQAHRAFMPLLGIPSRQDSYCDLRRITPVSRELIPESKRLMSMTEAGRERLHAHLVSFLIERELPKHPFSAEQK